MRRSAILLLLACVAGCERKVTLNVDVASFLDPGTLAGSYQTPAGTPDFTVDLPPQSIQIDGFDELRNAESIELELEVQYDNRNGSGHTTLILFFGDDAAAVFGTPAVAVIEADLAPDAMSIGNGHIQADARLLELFRRRQMWMGIRMRWQPQGDTALHGDYDVTRIDARVVARLGVF